MKNLAWVALVAAGALTVTACSGGENASVANTTDGSTEAGALTGNEEAGANVVTPVDGEGGLANGYDALPDTANGLDAAGNATDLTGNAASPAGNAF